MPSHDSLELICEALGISFEDFIVYGDASLSQLRAIKLIRSMSDEQLDAFCTLMNPSVGMQE